MSNSFTSFNGKQQDNQQNIKQFTQTFNGVTQWIYKYITTSNQVLNQSNQVLTPSNQNVDIYLPNNLTVVGSINSPSDFFCKKEVNELSKRDVLDLVNITPVSFKYINDKTEKKHFGVIAQEVEDYYPNLVSFGEDDLRTVNYIELIPLLLYKIKEQQKSIDELKMRIEDLETYSK